MPTSQFYFPAAAAATLLARHRGRRCIAVWFGARARGDAPPDCRWLARGGRATGSPRVAPGWRQASCGACCSSLRFSRSSGWRCGRSPSNGDFPPRCRKRGRSRTGCAGLTSLPGRRGPTLVDRRARDGASRLRSASACLENETASRTLARAGRRPALWLLYVPLLVPQVAFLFGAQVLLVRLEPRRLARARSSGRIWSSCCRISSCRSPIPGARSTRAMRARRKPRRVAGAGLLRRQAADPAAARC